MEGVTVDCRKSTEKSWITHWSNPDKSDWSKKQQNKLTYPGQFEMICYKVGDNSSYVDSSGTFKWDHIHEYMLAFARYMIPGHNDSDFMSMETSYNLNVFELWILSDRCNPNHHCGDANAFEKLL